MKASNKISTIVFRALSAARTECVQENGIDFEYTEQDVPSTGKGIHLMFEQAKLGKCRFKVYSGANDADTLYFSPQINLLYRAVHDIDHAIAYYFGRGTTKLSDELYLNCLMAKRVYDWTIKCCAYTHEDALEAFFAMYHDTVGQVHYYREHKDFCTDQRANTAKLISECLGVQSVRKGDINTATQVMRSYMVECGL